MRARRTKNLLTIAASIAAYLLLSINLSWGDTSISVYQAATTGALMIQTITCDGIPATPKQTVTIPNSCFTPSLFWDSAAGFLRLVGFDATGAPDWTGTIDATGVFSTTMAPPTPLPTTPLDCSSAPPIVASVVNAAFPASIPCTGYSAWSPCTGGVMTRTGTTPAGCVADQPTMLSCTPACTSWTYNPPTWPTQCAAGSIQTRTAIGSPPGCVGMPDQATIQSCPPQTCVYIYSGTTCNGTCTPTATGATTGTCPAAVTSVSPAGCTGGNTTPTTISCNPTATPCTSWTYSAWSPSDTSCTSGQLTRTITSSSPAGCQGGTPTLTEACPNVPPGSAIPLTYNKANVYYPIPAGGNLVFSASVASPQCTSTSNLYVSITAQQSSPKADLFLKKSNGGTATMPTLQDYNYLKGKSTGVGGLWSDNTSRGTFFWNGFVGDGSGETVNVYSSSLARAIPGFSLLDTYYIMVVNTSSTPSNQVYIQYYCF